MSIPLERHLTALLGSAIFNLTLRRGADPPRAAFVRDLADDDGIPAAVQRLFDRCDGRAPVSENRYPSDPILGDVKYCVDRFSTQPPDVKAAIQHFVATLLHSSAFKSLKGSRVRMDAYLRRRFRMGLRQARRESSLGSPSPNQCKVDKAILVNLLLPTLEFDEKRKPEGQWRPAWTTPSCPRALLWKSNQQQQKRKHHCLLPHQLHGGASS